MIPIVGKMLVACECSGVVREAFSRLNWDAWSADFEPSELEGQHYLGDVRDVLNHSWDLVIAHPPCTRIANSGNQWIRSRCVQEWPKFIEGTDFFRLFLHLSTNLVVIENPIPFKLALERIGVKYDQLIQPYQFGHPESKATCLWLKGLPKLKPTNDVKYIYDSLPKAQAQKVHYMKAGKERQKERSRTYTGIAAAMAKQWTEFYLEQFQ